MSETLEVPQDAQHTMDVPFQAASLETWDSKHRVKDRHGQPVDDSIDGENGTFGRVARSLANVEPKDQDYWFDQFYWALKAGCVPAGRITANVGAEKHKTAVSTINCTVSANIEDSMLSILQNVKAAGITLKHGCGIGYCFSTIRHNGAYVSGAGASTNGPLAFMDIYDKMCFTVSSAGGRRGAQMGTFDVSHPDVEAFIAAKREDGRLRQFNLSLLITEGFVEAVKNDQPWPLMFPIRQEELIKADIGELVYKDWPIADDGYVYDDQDRVACEIVSTIRAKDLWEKIMRATYDYAEPGFLLIDQINRMNNNWFCENIIATNPCGEQPLPPEGACLLGSINLARFIINPFSSTASFDWDNFKKAVKLFTRMLDNVVEINNLPLPGQRAEIERKRRHGMGYMGLGSACAMLGLKYGQPGAVAFDEEVTRTMAIAGWEVGLELAQEKGPAPIMNETFEITPKMTRLRPELIDDGYEVGDLVDGKFLWAKYSRYMQRIAEVAPDLVEQLADDGCRFTHHTSIAPTGSISLGLGNNVSNGIEPTFGHSYNRNIIVPGKKTKEQVEVQSFELLAYRHFVNPNATEADLPESCIIADDIEPEDHVRMQAAAQKWIDSSISKTVNVPTNFDYERFKNLYMLAYDHGLKGCTTFRFNPEVFTGVLVRNEDLENTLYEFTLEDGETVQVKGNQTVVYDGEEHNAANLYDALKENTYGKY